MKLKAVVRALHPRKVFRISRAAKAEVENVFVEVTDGGVSGLGEASPNAYYGETAREVLARVESTAAFVDTLEIESVADIAQAWHHAWRLLAPSRAAQCALDLALWDWLAKRKGVTVSQLALGTPLQPVQTFCTIGISGREELLEKIAELQGFPLIKIKSDARADLSAVRTVRERTGATLAVDANCAWVDISIAKVSRELAALGVAFIEQPLAPGSDPQMAEYLAASELPILADESCVALEDVERLPRRFSGFNIKLVKCGGLTPALAMARRGRELGLTTMVGCMLESSLLIAAGTVVAQQTDYADLDGAWLLADDPFEGTIPLHNGVLIPK
jgi:L-alanine-DL-glutamate epimerase-like enolase superfamily enzyme